MRSDVYRSCLRAEKNHKEAFILTCLKACGNGVESVAQPLPDSLVVLNAHARQRARIARSAAACGAYKNGMEQPFPFSMAFLPIIDVSTGKAFAYEALVRGSGTETTSAVMSKVTPENIYAFDQTCPIKAISLAARLGLAEKGALLCINFMPRVVYSPEACLRG